MHRRLIILRCWVGIVVVWFGKRLRSKRQPNSPNSCLFPLYHYPQSRGITCLLDMKCSLFGLSQAKREGHHVLSQLFDWLYLPHVLLLKWVVVKYSGVPLPGSLMMMMKSRYKFHTHTPAVQLERSAAIVNRAYEQRSARRHHRRTTLSEKRRQLSLCALQARSPRTDLMLNLPRLWARRDGSPAVRVLSTGAAEVVNTCSFLRRKGLFLSRCV
jgi:hypothetical protein